MGFISWAKNMRHYDCPGHSPVLTFMLSKGLFRKLMWPGAAYLNQQIVLTGGYDGDSRTNRAEVYN